MVVQKASITLKIRKEYRARQKISLYHCVKPQGHKRTKNNECRRGTNMTATIKFNLFHSANVYFK